MFVVVWLCCFVLISPFWELGTYIKVCTTNISRYAPLFKRVGLRRRQVSA